MLKYLRYCGLVTVALLWGSIATGVKLAHLDLFGKDPLSRLGVEPTSAPYFSIGLILAALSIILFTHYLKTKFVITKSFMTVLLIGQAGQVIAALAPYGGMQPARFIHTIAALTLAFSIPLALWRFAAAQKNQQVIRAAYALMWLEVAAFVVGIGLFSFVTKGAPFAQIMPAIAFHVWIIYFSFERSRRNFSA